MQRANRRQSRCGHGRIAVLVGATLALTASTLSAASEPRGFTDGTWSGSVVWAASVQFPEAFASSSAGGSFDVTFIGGVPDGTFEVLADGSSDTADASADLILSVIGSIGGDAESPTLVAAGATVSGTVIADAYPAPIPVDLDLDTGGLPPFPLDVRRAGCTFVSGNLDAEISQLSGQVGGAGGALAVERASWSAVRTGSAGATTPEQREALNQLVSDGIAIRLDIEGGFFDPADLEALTSRASAFASSIPRNSKCGIGDAAHFSTAVAGVMADLLVTMIANADWLSADDFAQAIIAGVAAGALGSNAGAEGDQLASQLLDVLAAKLTAAASTGDRDAMLVIAFAASTLGDTTLAALALEIWGT